MRRRSFVKAAEPNALQAKALRDAGCRRIFEDATRREIHESVISGRKTVHLLVKIAAGEDAYAPEPQIVMVP